MKKAIAGSALMLVSIWVGCWVQSLIPIFHWAGFPAFLTALLVFVFGMMLTIWAFVGGNE